MEYDDSIQKSTELFKFLLPIFKNCIPEHILQPLEYTDLRLCKRYSNSTNATAWARLASSKIFKKCISQQFLQFLEYTNLNL